MWSYSVMVITKDSESFNPGSSPGRTFFGFLCFLGRHTGRVMLTRAHGEALCLNAREV